MTTAAGSEHFAGAAIDRQQIMVAAAVTLLVLCLQYFLGDGPKPPRDDALRYSNYAVNLVEHQTFGLSAPGSPLPPAPGGANAPLYPFLVAIVAWASPGFERTLNCEVRSTEQHNGCPADYRALMLAQYGLLFCGLVLVWVMTRIWLGNPYFATVTMILATVSGVYSEYAQRVLTEVLILPLFILVQLSLFLLVKRQQFRWAAILGVVLGLLTLTRPEGLYVGLLLVAVSAVWIVSKEWRRRLGLLLISVICFGLTLSPWLWRNQTQLGRPVITAGGYAELILSYRLAFNQMNWSEWGAAWIYWLPDFGDKLAQAQLPESSYRRLISDHPDSFIASVGPQMLDAALAEMPREQVVGYWLKNEILGHFYEHARAGLVLLWRGIWVGKYWGIIGLAGYLFLLAKLRRAERRELLLLSMPVWLLVILHAGISINIPRYNLPLVPLYAMGWAYFLTRKSKRPGLANIYAPPRASLSRLHSGGITGE